MPKDVKVRVSYYDKEVVADLLTELLYLALVGPVAIRPPLVNLCEQLCEALDDEVVERCKDYARFRKNEYLKTLEE